MHFVYKVPLYKFWDCTHTKNVSHAWILIFVCYGQFVLVVPQMWLDNYLKVHIISVSYRIRFNFCSVINAVNYGNNGLLFTSCMVPQSLNFIIPRSPFFILFVNCYMTIYKLHFNEFYQLIFIITCMFLPVELWCLSFLLLFPW